MSKCGEYVILDVVENACQLGLGIGSQHCDARLAEVAYPFEQRCCRKVTPYVQYASILIDARDALIDLTSQQCHFLADGNLRHLPCEKKLLHLIIKFKIY